LHFVFQTEIIEECFGQGHLKREVGPADRVFELDEAVSAAAGNADIAARQGVGVGIERDGLFWIQRRLV